MTPSKYSVVIPVYNSGRIVGETIDRTVAFFKRQGWPYELILVNDGSKDNSWDILSDKALDNANIIAVDLDRNYGQHTAIFCGIQFARGNYVINMDDDLQNPPEALGSLFAKANDGHDVVFAKFIVKKHGAIRRVGSRGVAALDRLLFKKPRGLTVTNFRIFKRDIADKIRAYKAPYPYLRGLLLMYASNPANASVEHLERTIGKSNYTPGKILAALLRIFFTFSAVAPLRVVVWGAILACLGIVLLAIPIRVEPLDSLAGIAAGLMLGAGIVTLCLGALGWVIPPSKHQETEQVGYSIREIVGGK
jgi:glycosyltransferase involved in cell wall biosynthesis